MRFLKPIRYRGAYQNSPTFYLQKQTQLYVSKYILITFSIFRHVQKPFKHSTVQTTVSESARNIR